MTMQVEAPARAETAVAGSQQQRHGMRRLLLPITLGYCVVVVGLLVYWHLALTPDLLLLAFVPIGILSGRFFRWVVDWVPFVILLMGWETLRDFAPHFAGLPAHNGVMKLELLIFGGQIPSVTLQHWLDHGLVGQVFGYGATFAYVAHFAVPLVFGVIAWLVARPVFGLYVVSLLAMSFAAFLVFLLLPTAPPWLASHYGFLPPIDRILVSHLPASVSPYYSHLNPDEFAAFPSMHAAFPFLAFLAARRIGRWIAVPVAVWTLIVWFSIVYLGEHYVLDIVGGVVFAAAAWYVVGRLADRFAPQLRPLSAI